MTRQSFATRRAAALATALTLAATPALATDYWDLPLAWPEGNFHTQNAIAFAEQVGEVTEGRVQVTVHSGGALGFKGPEMLTAIRDGLAPIGDVYLSQQVGEAPILGMESIPYLVDGYDDLASLHEFFRPIVEEVAAEYNQKLLYLVPWPQTYVYTKEPVAGIDDLAGLKIRTYNVATTELFNAVGMTAVQLPWGEVVPSLAAGTIDSVTTSASSGVDGKFWEFLSHMYPTGHVWASNAVMVNLDAWGALDEADQAAIEALAAEMEPQFWEVSKAEDSSKVEVLLENGLNVGAVDPAMLAAMRAATADQMANFVEAVPAAAAPIDAFLEKMGRN